MAEQVTKAGRVIELPPDQMAIVERAVEKLNDKDQLKTSDRYSKVVLSSVREMLVDFCYQSSVFAGAIVDCKKTLAECCETIMKKCGSSISDLEVYRRAVQFYFPGAEIEYQMRIKVNPFEKETKEASEGVKTLSLLDILG